jgi:hypothetical protein
MYHKGFYCMPSKTVNTEMKKRVKEGNNLSVSVNNIEFCPTEKSSAIKMDRETALDLAQKIITAAHIMEDSNRINLTIFRNKDKDVWGKSITITSY